ncbi:MAG: aminomethyl-transferring glycine dehydrogenase subunit GcvPB [Acidilobaceae archaeon]|nr:aminomethyl-transferring glycine dehydrogenase subunit GcvPB [Acidilobaceae archaeon]
MFRQARWEEPLVFQLGRKGRRGFLLPRLEEEIEALVGEFRLPEALRREIGPELPSLSEVEVIRHFTRLSHMSYGVDLGPVPLGSCTMKYNPKIAMRYAFHEKLSLLHPLAEEDLLQGLLELLHRLQGWLEAITGMDACSLHPAAGSQGELAGALMIRKYHQMRGELERDEIIVPDSAHGTNPATGTMAGFKVIEVPTAEDGNIDVEAIRASVGPRTAGIMATVPSTLGLFDERALEIAEIVHKAGGLVYHDGANLNGILGRTRPGDLGADIVHLNLHKTFSSPHGGGGPGAGPVCVKDREVVGGVRLPDLLPGFRVVKEGGSYRLRVPSSSVGFLRAWFGNIAPLVWAYVYIASMGAKGLREAGEIAVLNTNYFAHLITSRSKTYSIPYGAGRPRKHEVVISAQRLQEETGVTAEDLAKGLLDAGFYAPTIYFPLIVKEALMVEFTESETKENIDAYAARLLELEEKAFERPEELKDMPKNTAKTRMDNARANHPRSVTPSWRVKVLREKGVISGL